jgi:hypothetical protein
VGWFDEAETKFVEFELFEGHPGAGRLVFLLASGFFLLLLGGRWADNTVRSNPHKRGAEGPKTKRCVEAPPAR